MLNQKVKELIESYHFGQVSEEEVSMVFDLFAEGTDNVSLKNHLRKEWETIDSDDAPDLTHLLHAIQAQIYKKQQEKHNGFIYRIMHSYSRVAAILLFPILLAGLFFFLHINRKPTVVADIPVFNTVYAPMGSRVQFTLPDGSSGFLNSGSSITYSLPFAENRKLSLEGEAWFDVIKNENHPFEICAGTSAVRVLGTSFNVSAYPNENYVEVVLAEGKVEFQATPRAQVVPMKISERLVYKENGILIENVDPDKYRGWTEGLLIFRGDNMSEVARRISRWYNVEVVIADTELEAYTFRATFDDDSLEEVLRLLSMTSPIRYRIKPRVELPDGNWSKEIVTLYYKQ